MLTSAQTETTDSGAHSPPPQVSSSQAQQHDRQKHEGAWDSADKPMTDEDREAAAYRAGCAMRDWYARYQQTGDAKYLDMAYEAMGLMRKLLAGRSKQAVLRQEISKGLL